MRVGGQLVTGPGKDDGDPDDVLRPSAPEIAAVLDVLLDAERYRAEEPENGLLIDAVRSVRRIGAAVNTSRSAIEAAAEAGIDLLLVHHASWPDIDLRLHKRKMDRLRELGISLYVAHASLDAAPEIGTGDALAGLIGLPVEGRFASYMGGDAGVHGGWAGTLGDLAEALQVAIGGSPEVHANLARCERVGMVTGGGGLTSYLDEAIDLGCDTYLTGEGGMYTRLFAKEAGLNLVLGGHYRTEAPGIRALAEHAAGTFALPWLFVEDDAIG